jgi:hypothetical protein
LQPSSIVSFTNKSRFHLWDFFFSASGQGEAQGKETTHPVGLPDWSEHLFKLAGIH